MRILRTDVLVGGRHGRISAGTAEHEIPAGVLIGNPKAWIECEAEADAPSIEVGQPARSAPKADWLAFATSRGLGPEYLGDKPTKERIIEVLDEAGELTGPE